MADSADEIRCRVFLKNIDTGAMRYVLWTSLRGGEFYWGTPRPAPDVPSTLLGPGETTLEIPEGFADLATAYFKTSFHESGVMHVTTDGSGAQELGDVYVGPVTSFTNPTMFAALFTAVPDLKEDFSGNPNKKGARTITVTVPDELWRQRWYLDFSISPAGTFEHVPGVGIRDGALPTYSTSISLSVELDLILVVRFGPVGGEFNSWHPDKDILVMVTPVASSSDDN